ncbi:MAG: hypothetical protein VB084_02885 [Syntrophomonadaceae bacterium]|nr:hypothetical protein [Syntrophomonadaceae bacterium]
MANYKVSYKVLKQQGEELKAVAKLLDGYNERLNQVASRLGQDETLAQIRTNLQKFGVQLGESRAIINTAGELLSKSVESYSNVETRQVKRVDSLKAHNRDFYQNPVVVASAGGAAGIGAAAMSSGSADASLSAAASFGSSDSANVHTIDFIESGTAAADLTAAAGTVGSGGESGVFSSISDATGISPEAAAGLGGVAAGAAMGVGGVIGAQQLKKKTDEKAAREKTDQKKTAAPASHKPQAPSPKNDAGKINLGRSRAGTANTPSREERTAPPPAAAEDHELTALEAKLKAAREKAEDLNLD